MTRIFGLLMQEGPPVKTADTGILTSLASVVHCAHAGRVHAHAFLLAVTLITLIGPTSVEAGDDATDLATAAEVGDLARVKVLLDANPALVSSKVIAPATAHEQFPGLRFGARQE
jgi:hypothetical protein